MLTNSDIDLLLEALDAYQGKFITEGFNSAMLGLIFSSKEDREKTQNEFTSTLEDAKKLKDQTEEKVILLKAKLITMRDKVVVDEAMDCLKSGTQGD